MCRSSRRFFPSWITAPATFAIQLALVAPALGQESEDLEPLPVEEQPDVSDSAAPPEPEEPAATTAQECVPPCRDTYTCVAGACVSICNPPCGPDERCTPEAQCVREAQRPQQPTPPSPMVVLEAPMASGLERAIENDAEYQRYRRKMNGGIVLIVLGHAVGSAAGAFSVVAALEPDIPHPVLISGGLNVASAALLIPGIINLSKGIRGQRLVAGYYESQGAGAGPSPAVSDPHGRSALRAAGWVFLSAGLACAVAGAVTGVMSLRAFEDAEMNVCNSETGCPDTNDAARKDQLLLTTNLLFGASNALGAVGGAMLIVGILKEGGDPDVSLLPVVGPRHAGLALSISF